MASVLVTYATKFGSTREVADRVAARLLKAGMQTEVLPAGEVRSLEGYDAVVFGGALYMFRLVGEGRRFLSRNSKALSRLPLAVFAMGPLEDTETQYFDARGHLDKTLTKLKDVHPVEVTVFGGVLNPDKLKFPYSNPGIKAMGASDLRDWEAIEAWSDALPEALGIKAGTVAAN